MLNALNNFRTKITARRIALLAAPLALMGAATSSVYAAGPWYHSRGPQVIIEPRVVFRADFPPQRVVLSRPAYVDEVPAGLQMTAYQSRDRVIVLINGTNRGEGFRTALSDEGGGTLVLHNTAPEGCRE